MNSSSKNCFQIHLRVLRVDRSSGFSGSHGSCDHRLFINVVDVGLCALWWIVFGSHNRFEFRLLTYFMDMNISTFKNHCHSNRPLQRKLVRLAYCFFESYTAVSCWNWSVCQQAPGRGFFNVLEREPGISLESLKGFCLAKVSDFSFC